MPRLLRLFPALLGVLLLAPGCATISQLAALQQVDFRLDSVSNGFVAGVPLDNARAGQLGPLDIARLGTAIARGSAPMRFNLNVGASNPSGNGAAAQLVSLDWTLFLDGNQTVSGVYNDDRLIPPGTTTLLPVGIEFDLVELLGRDVGAIARLVGNVAGVQSQRQTIRLDARPTINTQFGPIRYPGVISIEFPVGG